MVNFVIACLESLPLEKDKGSCMHYHESEKKWQLVTQSCLTLCDPMDCSPPGSSVHEILQARIMEWVAISFSRGSSQPRHRTRVSCIAGRLFTIWVTREESLNIKIKILSEVSQTQKDKYHMMSLLCGIWKRGANELIYKTEVESPTYRSTIETRMLSAILVKVHVRGSWVYS